MADLGLHALNTAFWLYQPMNNNQIIKITSQGMKRIPRAGFELTNP